MTYADQVRGLLRSARNRVIIVSAFIRCQTLAYLLSGAILPAEAAIYARWRPHDILSGASDLATYDMAHNMGAEFKIHPSLHAKIYIADDIALIGSANATESGLGRSISPNLEALAEIPANHAAVVRVLSTLSKESKIPDMRFYQSLASVKPCDLTRSGDDSTSIISSHWLPATQPQALIDCLQGKIDMTQEALHDIIHLHLTPDVTIRQVAKRFEEQEICRILLTELNSQIGDRAMSAASVTEFLARYARCGNDSATQKWNILASWVDFFEISKFHLMRYENGHIELRQGHKISN